MKSNEPPIRIWFQSFVDAALGGPYLDHLRPHLDRIRGANTEVTLHRNDPSGFLRTPVDGVSMRAIGHTERNTRGAGGLRCRRVRPHARLRLWEARASVSIPVLSLGETSMLHACTLGARSGIVTINSRFIPGFVQQIAKYGLQQRVLRVLSVNHQPGELMRSFESADDAQRVIAEFKVQAQRLIADGVDVVIPGGGIPMLLLAEANIREIDGAPVPRRPSRSAQADRIGGHLAQIKWHRNQPPRRFPPSTGRGHSGISRQLTGLVQGLAVAALRLQRLCVRAR